MKITSGSRISPRLIIALLITIIFAISLLFRIVLPYGQVYDGEWIKYTSIDAYFHMRLVDNTAYNFPHLMDFDPYNIFPGGHALSNIFFPDWLLAGIIWILTLGAPTPHSINAISVLFPAIIAALTVIPVYFIGKTLFNRWVGVLAAGLMAVLPGEYLGRTILGLNDTPGIETLLSTTFLAFIILAVKTARERGLTFEHLVKGDWGKCARPLVYGAFAGLFLGMYLISWIGALLFVFIFALYLVIQFIKDHLARRSVDYLVIIGVTATIIALIIYSPISTSSYYIASLILAIIIPVALFAISRAMELRKIPPLYYPLAVVVIGGIAAGIFYGVKPDLFRPMLSLFNIFAPGGAMATTTIEMRPFLAPTGSFTTAVSWGNFTTSFFLFSTFAFPGVAIISLSVLMYLFVRKSGTTTGYLRPVVWTVMVLLVIMIMLLLSGYGHRYWALGFGGVLIAILFMPGEDKEHWLVFLVWSIVILALTLGQRRFAYYLVVNVAVLSAYLSWQIVRLAGLGKLSARREAKSEKEHYHIEAPKKRGYYEILGINRSASSKEIKKAYRSLSHRYHPGVSRSPETEEKLKEINEAYAVLSNPERRAAYDQSRSGISESKAKARKKSGRREFRGVSYYVIGTAVASLAVFFLVFFPNIVKATEMTTAEEAAFAPPDAWMSAMTWMKDNTPEPLGDPEAYYRLYEPPPPGETFPYPASAYGVTSWWDYGYWITQIAHRIPSANPSQEPVQIRNVANLFLSSDDETTRALLEKMGTGYVVIDDLTTLSKYWAVITWAGQVQEKYSDYYLVSYQGQWELMPFYHTDYFQTLAVRLYNFDGKAVTDVTPIVFTYENKVDTQGFSYKQVTAAKVYDSYQEAIDFIEGQTSGNHVIVSSNPLVSPVPLEAVPDFQLVYSSQQGTSFGSVGFVPEVKIFEYTGTNK